MQVDSTPLNKRGSGARVLGYPPGLRRLPDLAVRVATSSNGNGRTNLLREVLRDGDL